MTRRWFQATALMVPMMLATSLSAKEWQGGVGDWSNPDNWSPFGIAFPDDDVVIAEGEVTHDGTLDRQANTQLSQTGILHVNGNFRNASDGAAHLTIANDAVINHQGNYFMVGRNAPGSVIQNGGIINSTITQGWFLSDESGGSAEYHLNGGLLNVNVSGTGNNNVIQFGKIGQNDLFHVNGGTAVFENVGSSTSRRVYIRRDATLLIDSGSVTFSGFQYFSIGRESSGEARVVVNDGAFNVLDLSGALVVGGAWGNPEDFHTGILEVNGGQISITGGGGLWVGDGGRGIVEQSGGDILMQALDVVLGRSANAVGSYYSMSGGSLLANNIVISDNAPDDVAFHFTGGDIYLTGDRRNLLEQDWFLAIDGATATYDAVLNQTHITVPEPASAMVLVAGTLLLLRRRSH